MYRNTAPEGSEATTCNACELVPVAHLALDIAEPLIGWTAFFAARGVEVVEDDVGRPSVPRQVIGDLLIERSEREARLAAERAERVVASAPVLPAGIPAVAGSTPMESIMANDPGYMTVEQELGRGGGSVFTQLLDKELAKGRRQERQKRAEAEAIKKANRVLEENKQ